MNAEILRIHENQMNSQKSCNLQTSYTQKSFGLMRIHTYPADSHAARPFGYDQVAVSLTLLLGWGFLGEIQTHHVK